MMFPQVKKVEKINPRGGWDFFGYTGKDYCTKDGPQPKAIKGMIDRLISKFD